MFQMAVDYEESSTSYSNGLLYVNLIFTSIFTLECILKLIAFGKVYFNSSWNKFDFFVVVSSILEIFLSSLASSGQLAILRIGPQLARVLRILRVSRLLRLVNKYKGLQALIQTITFSISSLLNVFCLLLLIFFIYAVLGVFIFNKISKGDVIDDYTNFKNFGQAMMILLKVATGEDWNKIMYDTSRTKPNCIEGETCGTSIAPLYFISFIMICSFVLLNLFILVIIQQFETYYLPETNILQKFKNNLEIFKTNWAKFSSENNGIRIKDKKLVDFFEKLETPLGFMDENLKFTKKQIVIEILKMDLVSDNEGFIYFNELLFRCMKR